MSNSPGADPFTEAPDPGAAGTIEGLVNQLRLLKVWAGDPSYDLITARVNRGWTASGRPGGELARKSTVADCFRSDRQRLNADLVVAVVAALHPSAGYAVQWRQALQVVGGTARASSQVRVHAGLPRDLAEFTGRTAELDRLMQGPRAGSAVATTVITGMAGVGKTRLAIRAGHRLVRSRRVDRVLFVDLRGFHPDATQPPADPAAVLGGFLRLLGVPGHQVPHGVTTLAADYRARLAGSRTLVVLDNAVDTEQVTPLLTGTPHCPVLVTSRQELSDLPSAGTVLVDVFTPDEAEQFLRRAAPGRPLGQNPGALDRIARRCGYLPLALDLMAGRIRDTPGWTLTDHADRLDERHQVRRLETGVELALELSYQQLTPGGQRMMRLAGLHPGQDVDAYAAAALTDTDLPSARAHLRELRHAHLLQPNGLGRYTVHDLVRSYAAGQSGDHDSASERRAALTRLFDHYLAAAAEAMTTLYPAEAHRRPRVPRPTTPTPVLAKADAAQAWLDIERPTLVAVAAHTATAGWPSHTARLSTILFRYLESGHHADALIIYDHALSAADQAGDPIARAHALTSLGGTCRWQGRHERGIEYLEQAVDLFQEAHDCAGHARALGSLGLVEAELGRFRAAIDRYENSLHLCRQAGDPIGAANALGNLGIVEARLGRHALAADHHREALHTFQQADHTIGIAAALGNLGDVEIRLGDPSAADHLTHSAALFARIGVPASEAEVLNSLGTLHTRHGRPDRAVGFHQQALAIVRDLGARGLEASTRNGLGEAAQAAGALADALGHLHAAHALAAEVGDRDQHARAHADLGHTHVLLSEPDQALEHYRQALSLYEELEVPEVDEIRGRLAALAADRR